MELIIDNINRPEFSAILNKINTLDETSFSLENAENLKQLSDLLRCSFNTESLKPFLSDLPYSKINIYIKSLLRYYLVSSFDNTNQSLPVGNFIYTQTNNTIKLKSFDITSQNPKYIVTEQSLQPINYFFDGSNMANYRIYFDHYKTFLKQLNNISPNSFDIYSNTFKDLVNYFFEDLEGNPTIKDNKLINSYIITASLPFLYIKIFANKINLSSNDYEIELYKSYKNNNDYTPSILERSKTTLELIENIKANITPEIVNDELINCYSNTKDIKYLQLLKIYNNFNKDDYRNDPILLSYTQQFYKNIDNFENFKYNKNIYSNKKLILFWFIWDLVLIYFLFNPTQKLLLEFSPNTQMLFYDIYVCNFIINSNLLQNKNILYAPFSIDELPESKESTNIIELINHINNNTFLPNLKDLFIEKSQILLISDILLPFPKPNYSIVYDLLFSNYFLEKIKILQKIDIIKSFSFPYYFNLVALYKRNVKTVMLIYVVFMELFVTTESRLFNIPQILTDYNLSESSQTLAVKIFQKSDIFEELVLNIINNPNPKIKALCNFIIPNNIESISKSMKIFNYVRNTMLLNYYYQSNGFNRDLIVESTETHETGVAPKTELFIIQTIKNDWYEGLVKIAEQTGGINDVFKHLIKNDLLGLNIFKLSSSNYCNYIKLYFSQLNKLDFKTQKNTLFSTNKIVEILNIYKNTILSDEDIDNIKCLIDNYIEVMINLQSQDKSTATKWLTTKEIKTFLNTKTSDGYNLYHLAVLINNVDLINYIFSELELKIKLSISVKELDNDGQNLFFLIKDYRILELLLTKNQFQNKTVLEELCQKVNSGNHGLISAWHNNNDTSKDLHNLLNLTLRYFNYDSNTIIPGFYRNMTSIILTNTFDNLQELFLVLQTYNLLDENINDILFLFEDKMLAQLSEEEKARFIHIYNINEPKDTMSRILEYCIQNNKDNSIMIFLLLIPNQILIKHFMIFINNNYDLMKIIGFFNREVIIEQYKSGTSILHYVAKASINSERYYFLFKYLFERLNSEDIKTLQILKSLCELPNINTTDFNYKNTHILDVLTYFYKIITKMNMETINEDIGQYKAIHVLFGNGRSVTWQNVGMYLNIYYYLYTNTTPMPSFVPYPGYNDTSSGTKIIVNSFAENDFDCDLVPEEANKEGLPVLEHYLTVPSIAELEKNHFSYSYKI